MNEELELALKKMNEALSHLDNFRVFDEGEELDFDIDDLMADLEDVIEPLSDMWQEIYSEPVDPEIGHADYLKDSGQLKSFDEK